MSQAFRIVALGGLGEVGMNCLVIEAEGRVLVIDCGVTFPDYEPGIDIIHPEFEYLLERADAIEAVVITHGHEDHIGALPYLLREVDVPIYGPPYALALVQERLREADLDQPPVLHETKPRVPIALGPFEVTPFRVTHSIPDSTGLVIRAGGETLVHSGDFKIDDDPMDGERFDEDLLAECGKNGVRLLMSDSTNSEVDGCAGNERPVTHALDARMAQAEGRIVISLFASNVHRLGAVLQSARAHGRRVLFLGRALHTHARVAESLAMLPQNRAVLVAEHEAQTLPRNQLLVIATGSQGEHRAALRRLAHETHPVLKLDAGDEVVLSSRIIPGRERQVHAIIDAFERNGVRVWTRRDDAALHVSGHACRAEQRRMIELTRPRAFLPVHGAFVHLQRHAALARELGVTETLAVENGAVIELDAAGMRIAEQVVTGRVHIQHGGEVPHDVMRDRMRMAEGGVVLVWIVLDTSGALAQPPLVSACGVTDALELDELGVIEETRAAITRAIASLDRGADAETVEHTATRAARRVFRDALGFRPLVHCAVQTSS